jgi:hypothetical protein
MSERVCWPRHNPGYILALLNTLPPGMKHTDDNGRGGTRLAAPMTEPKRPNRIPLELTPQLRERLDAIRSRTGQSLAEMIREAVAQYCARQERAEGKGRGEQ